MVIPLYRRVKDKIYRDQVYKAILEDCNAHFEINGQVVGGVAITILPLVKPGYIETIPDILTSETANYGKINLSLNK